MCHSLLGYYKEAVFCFETRKAKKKKKQEGNHRNVQVTWKAKINMVMVIGAYI